jgi:hypothetical protein
MSAGVPVLGSFNGIPLTGSWFFVDYQYGSDGNGVASGRTASGGTVGGAPPNAPMKTLAAAHNLCLAGNNDVVVLMSDGTTASTQRQTTTLSWTKNATHLLGMSAPCMEGQRARISTASGATTNLNPLVSISASDCIFANFSMFQGVGQASTDEQLINITGLRNYFGNVQFGGMGNAVGAGRAGSYIILLDGAEENLFEHCSVGLETIQRSAANASVKVRNGAHRNNFRNCDFPMAASATSPLFLDVNATNALNGGSMRFRDCTFSSLLNISSAATPAVVAVVASDANGTVYFSNCAAVATNWAANGTLVQVSNSAVSSPDGGLAVAIS